MKLRILLFPLVLLGMLVIWGTTKAFADTPLQWQVPYFGTLNLDLTTTQAVLGYDGILKQSIAGASLPVYTDPKGIVTLQVGAVAPWSTNAASVEPLIMAGHNLAKELPFLSAYPNLGISVFGRYATAQGKAGAGIAISYAFAGGTVSPPPAPANP